MPKAKQTDEPTGVSVQQAVLVDSLDVGITHAHSSFRVIMNNINDQWLRSVPSPLMAKALAKRVVLNGGAGAVAQTIEKLITDIEGSLAQLRDHAGRLRECAGREAVLREIRKEDQSG